MSSLTPDPDDRMPWRQAAVALVFFALSVSLMYLPASRQHEVASAVRSTVLRPFLVTRETIVRARNRAEETSRLRRRLDSLALIVAAHRPLAEENRRLREQLGIAERLAPGYEPANLLRAGTEGSRSMFLVDIGLREGVRPGAPVVVRDGLVGVIRDVGARRSLGMDWTHPEFRASAMTRDGATYGIVERREGEHRDDDRLVLTGIPFHSELDDGTPIVTSGRGGVYPRGLPIGTVDGVSEEEGGWRKSYWIRPAVEVGSAIHVLVGVRRESPAPAGVGAEEDSVPVPAGARAESVPAPGGAAREEVDSVPEPERR